jgi:nucleotide-binding universal stress UspA family protein
MTEFRRILVGWDNSPGAVAALRAAAAIADDGAAQVTVLAVLKPTPHTEDADEGTADFEGRRDHARETFGKAIQTLADDVRPRVTLHFAQSGDPARTVCEYAHDHGFDLLVLGRHGVGGLLHPRLGHVAATAARKSALPLLLAS